MLENVSNENEENCNYLIQYKIDNKVGIVYSKNFKKMVIIDYIKRTLEDEQVYQK